MDNATLNTLKTLTLKKNTEVTPDVVEEQQPQTVETERWYRSVRYGMISDLYVIGVKKDKVLYKDHPDMKHVNNISLAKFLKLYKKRGK